MDTKFNESYSQAGQDLFVLKVTKQKENGTFLDIGSAHPEKFSNTFLLEKNYKWLGYSIEMDRNLCDETIKKRKTTLFCSDATKINYNEIFSKEKFIDYISLDIDGDNTLKVLKMLPINLSNTGIITFEHEFYQIGDRIKKESREILEGLGFYLICSDVCNIGNSFEDWYINPTIFNLEDLNYLESNYQEWNKIVYR